MLLVCLETVLRYLAIFELTVFQIHFLKSKITLKYIFESSTEQEEQKKIQRLSYSQLVSSLKNCICQAE